MELPFVWNTPGSPFGRLLVGEPDAVRPLATAIHATWAAFIRVGDPNGSGLPHWPRYDAARPC